MPRRWGFSPRASVAPVRFYTSEGTKGTASAGPARSGRRRGPPARWCARCRTRGRASSRGRGGGHGSPLPGPRARGTRGREAARDGPDVQVVDLLDALNADHLLPDLVDVYAVWGLFEQDVDRVAQELPGASKDEQGDEGAD